MPPSALRVHAALLVVSLLFGANYVVIKHILAVVDSRAWVAFRIVGATIVIWPLARWLGRNRPRPPRRLWPALMLASLLGLVGNQILFTEGLARTTPEHSAVVNACIPMWTLLAAAAAGQERLGLRQIAAILSALAGVSWLLGVDRILFAGAADPGASLLGDLLTMANGMVFATHLVLLRKIGRDLDPYHTTALLFAFSAPMVSAWSAPAVDLAALEIVLTPPLLFFALYAVLAATVLTYFLNTWALRYTHSSQVALYINTQPLVAAALNTALGSPLPGQRFFVALALVGLGLWLRARSGAR